MVTSARVGPMPASKVMQWQGTRWCRSSCNGLSQNGYGGGNDDNDDDDDDDKDDDHHQLHDYLGQLGLAFSWPESRGQKMKLTLAELNGN